MAKAKDFPVREQLLDRLETILDPNIRQHIVWERAYRPDDFAHDGRGLIPVDVGLQVRHGGQQVNQAVSRWGKGRVGDGWDVHME